MQTAVDGIDRYAQFFAREAEKQTETLRATGAEMQQTRSQLAVAWLKLLLLKGQEAQHAHEGLLHAPLHSAAMHGNASTPAERGGPLVATGRAISPSKR